MTAMFLESMLKTFGNDLIDVIREAVNTQGQRSIVAEISALDARHTNKSLVTIAREWFGHGRIRQVGKGMYAVLTPMKAKTLPVFPSWVYHVA
jgi:hypothetical protein